MYVGVEGNKITCRFIRENYNPSPNYIYQNGENLYVMAAYGNFVLDGKKF